MAPRGWIHSLFAHCLPALAAALLVTPAHAQDCGPVEYATTAEAIQAIIFDSAVYSCSTGLCHSSIIPGGTLNLTAGTSFGQLIGVPAFAAPTIDRVEPGEPALSFLYQKLRWAKEASDNVGM